MKPLSWIIPGGTTIVRIPHVNYCEDLARDRDIFGHVLSLYLECCSIFDYWISKDRFITEEEFRHRLELKDFRASYLEMYLQTLSPEVYFQRYFDSIKHSVWDDVC